MRRISIVIAIVCFLNLGAVFGQDGGTAKPFVLRLSHDLDPTLVSIRYYLTYQTDFVGGHAGGLTTRKNLWDYEIPTSDGRFPTKSVRIIVYGPKYKVRTLDFPDLNDQGRVINVKLEPQATLRFTGKVLLRHSLSKKLELYVGYFATWMCDPWSPDCLTGLDPVTSVEVDREGRFRVELPDFVHDPGLSSFVDKGAFSFSIRDRKTWNTVYRLEPENSRKGWHEVRVAPRYPAEQIFIAVPSR